MAIPGPRGGFLTVYILGPIIGAVLGGVLYDRVIRPPALSGDPQMDTRREMVEVVAD